MNIKPLHRNCINFGTISENCCYQCILGEDKNMEVYEYYINLDERGSFFADVRNDNGKTVFTIKAGNELAEDESSIFEDGFMKHTTDLTGLREYLIDLGIMKQGDKLIIR